MPSQRPRAEHVRAAVAAARTWGLADPSLGLSVRSAADALGVDRSRIYREWPTVADLNDDGLRFLLFADSAWPRRLLHRSPSEPVDRAVAAAVGHPAHDPSALVRAYVSAFPPTSLPRQELVRWERSWFRAFGTWLHQHLAASGRAHVDGSSDLVLAVALTALVEGFVLVTALDQGLTYPAWTGGHARRLERSVARLVEAMTRPNDGGAPPHDLRGGSAPAGPAAPGPGELDGAGLDPARADLLRRLIAAGATDLVDGPGSPVVPRLVDMGRLSQATTVSERRLFTVWPKVADLNADVLVGLLAELRRETEAIAAEAFEVGLQRSWGRYRSLAVSGMDAVIRAGAEPAEGSYRMGVLAVLESAVREAVAVALADWRASTEVSFLALLAMTGRHPRPGVAITELTSVVFHAVAGAQRIGALHPDLLAATVSSHGRLEPLLGTVGAFVLSSVASVEPAPADTAEAAPPLG